MMIFSDNRPAPHARSNGEEQLRRQGRHRLERFVFRRFRQMTAEEDDQSGTRDASQNANAPVCARSANLLENAEFRAF